MFRCMSSVYRQIFNLHGELVAGVAASIDDVEAGHWHEDVLHLGKSRHERESEGNRKRSNRRGG